MKRASLVVLFLFMLWSCGGRPPAPAPQAANEEQSVITGKIIGYRSQAPAMARVDVYEPDRSDAPVRLEAAPDGSYAVATSRTGVVRLSFAGALHNSFSVPLLLLKPTRMKIDVRLSPYEWESEFKEIIVIGDFNQYSRTTGYALMVKQPDGTFATELGNLAGNKLGYRLIGLVKGSTRSVPGTQFDELALDPGGNFVSRVAIRNGRVRIVFDPALLPHGGPDAGVTFEDSDSEIARIASVEVAMRKRQEEFSRALSRFTRFGNDAKNFSYDWSTAVADLRRRLAGEKESYLRQMLFLSLLDLKHWRAEQVDAQTAREALAAVPPDSLLWELAPPYLLFESLKLAGGLGTYRDYFETVVTRHASREVRATVLEQAYGDAMSALDMERAKEYYQRLTNELGDLVPESVKTRPPELKIATGKIMPEFSFTSLDNPSKTITNETFKGRCYLVDFWATWSAASVSEMASLSKTYEKYKTKNFAILSVSFDRAPEDVQRFRAQHWRMPWYHGFVGRDEIRKGSRIMQYFELPELPKAILVGSNGRIVAVGRDLLGEKLLRQVDKLLAN